MNHPLLVLMGLSICNKDGSIYDISSEKYGKTFGMYKQASLHGLKNQENPLKSFPDRISRTFWISFSLPLNNGLNMVISLPGAY